MAGVVGSIDSAGTYSVVNPVEAADQLPAELVDLKFFCGFSFAEIAALQKLSERTAQRRWEKARIYLYRSLRAGL